MTRTTVDGNAQTHWIRCPECREISYRKRFVRDLRVCPACGWPDRLPALDRFAALCDRDSVRLFAFPRSTAEDPLDFRDIRPYRDRLAEARATTGLDDAVVCGSGRVEGHPFIGAIMDFRFLGGSLGCAVGERITAAAERALAERLPFVIVSASGGARMQEGVLSLMQMAKTSQAMAALDEAGVLTVTIVTDPTYGGVAASYATLSDVIVAESRARMGFAGPRVIAQTINRTLPDGFQTAESLLTCGLIDCAVPRGAVRATLARLLSLHSAPGPTAPGPGATNGAALITDPAQLPRRDAWEVVGLARDNRRPTALDYIHHLVDGFQELHGDRVSGDCPAMVGGVGLMAGAPVVVLGHQKGHDTSELVSRNFGMPMPAGFRKTDRLMRLAAKLRVPVVTFIDTPGAYPGVEAEQGGQAGAIAGNLRRMAGLPVPIVAVVTGEGGSGGALALALADRTYALGNATFSVISPEGCAAILWRNAEAAPQAARALQVDVRQLLRHRVIDGVIPERGEGAHAEPAAAVEDVRDTVARALDELRPIDPERLVRERRKRFRELGAGRSDG